MVVDAMAVITSLIAVVANHKPSAGKVPSVDLYGGTAGLWFGVAMCRFKL